MTDSPFWRQLEEQLITHEGKRRIIYDDSKGIPTIGIGRNLRHKGLNEQEIMFLFRNDIIDAMKALHDVFGPHWLSFTQNRQIALIDLMHNLGKGDFLEFKKMIAAIKANDWKKAAAEALDSKWAREDVQEERVTTIHRQLLSG